MVIDTDLIPIYHSDLSIDVCLVKCNFPHFINKAKYEIKLLRMNIFYGTASNLCRGVVDTLCEKVLSVTCDRSVVFSGNSVSNKTDCHDMIKILLKVALNTINHII